MVGVRQLQVVHDVQLQARGRRRVGQPPAAEGQATSFDVVQLGSSVEGLQVTCDGEPFDGWSRSDEGCVTVTTTVSSHSFVFNHGLRGEVGSGSTGARL